MVVYGRLFPCKRIKDQITSFESSFEKKLQRVRMTARGRRNQKPYLPLIRLTYPYPYPLFCSCKGAASLVGLALAKKLDLLFLIRFGKNLYLNLFKASNPPSIKPQGSRSPHCPLQPNRSLMQRCGQRLHLLKSG